MGIKQSKVNEGKEIHRIFHEMSLETSQILTEYLTRKVPNRESSDKNLCNLRDKGKHVTKDTKRKGRTTRVNDSMMLL